MGIGCRFGVGLLWARAVQSIKSLSSRRWIIVSLCLLAGVVAAGAIGVDIMRRAAGMQLADTSADAVVGAPSGGHIKAVVRIENAAPGGAFKAQILENTQGADYRATGRRIPLALTPDTHFIMGASSDVKTGAIVQADGAMDASHTLRAAKIVVLNDYVHVAPKR